MTDVSRETPPAPDGAQGVFGVRLPLAERYAGWLAGAGVVRGLIGPREVPRLWERHILNSAAAAPLLPEGVTVCDLGSGAGLPGLVLAIARPDLRVTLVEPLLRRTTFLDEVVRDLGLVDQVEVVRGRAEDLHGTRTFDVVTSRAVAPLPRLLRWSMPLVAPTGLLLAMKGSSVADEVAEAAAELRALGCAEPEIIDAGGATLLGVSWADPGRVGWRPSVSGSRKQKTRTGRGRRRS